MLEMCFFFLLHDKQNTTRLMWRNVEMYCLNDLWLAAVYFTAVIAWWLDEKSTGSKSTWYLYLEIRHMDNLFNGICFHNHYLYAVWRQNTKTKLLQIETCSIFIVNVKCVYHQLSLYFSILIPGCYCAVKWSATTLLVLVNHKVDGKDTWQDMPSYHRQ